MKISSKENAVILDVWWVVTDEGSSEVCDSGRLPTSPPETKRIKFILVHSL